MPSPNARILLAAAAAVCLPGGVASAQGRCADNSAPVYFAQNSAELTPTSDEVLKVLMRRAAACRIDGVTLVGRGDARGPGRDDPELALRRAHAVADHLVAAGLPRDEIRLLPKPAEAPARRVFERRVTVHMHLSPAPEGRRTN